MVVNFVVSVLALRSYASSHTAQRATMPWRLSLEDVPSTINVNRIESLEALNSIAIPLARIGSTATLTTSEFVCVCAPLMITSATENSALDTVVAHLEPRPKKPIVLVDAVPLFTCATKCVFRCANSNRGGVVATAARLENTPVWLLFDSEFEALDINKCASSITRAQFIELQETFSALLGLRLVEDNQA